MSVPLHRIVYPRLVPRPRPALPEEPPFDLELKIEGHNGLPQAFPLHSVTSQLLADRLTVVRRDRPDGGGRLETIQSPATIFEDCHFHHQSVNTQVAISGCADGELVSKLLAFPTHSFLVPHSVARSSATALCGCFTRFPFNTRAESGDQLKANPRMFSIVEMHLWWLEKRETAGITNSAALRTRLAVRSCWRMRRACTRMCLWLDRN